MSDTAKTQPVLSEDGYPDEADLESIRTWDFTDFPALMTFIKPIWNYADSGYWKQDGYVYTISTGGWSGNESIIAALRGHRFFWMYCAVSWRRGGHYEFEVKPVTAK